MDKITLPKSYNYISAFLSFHCNMKCHYCINKVGQTYQYKYMKLNEWVQALNRIETFDIPITFSGGEPTIFKHFYEIVNSVNRPMDLLTNGQFDVQEFMSKVSAKKFKRNAPYASIRFSYHPGYSNLFQLLRKVRFMKKRGYEVGIWAVNHPDSIDDILFAKKTAEERFELDFRLKEFLGEHNGKLSGTYMYPDMLKPKVSPVMCKPSELLIAPDGRLFRCHQHLYSGKNSYGHILDEQLVLPTEFEECSVTEPCNNCDLKLKNDRFQRFGHCSVTIKPIDTADSNGDNSGGKERS